MYEIICVYHVTVVFPQLLVLFIIYSFAVHIALPIGRLTFFPAGQVIK